MPLVHPSLRFGGEWDHRTTVPQFRRNLECQKSPLLVSEISSLSFLDHPSLALLESLLAQLKWTLAQARVVHSLEAALPQCLTPARYDYRQLARLVLLVGDKIGATGLYTVYFGGYHYQSNP